MPRPAPSTCLATILLTLAMSASAQGTFAPSSAEHNWSTTASQLRLRGVHSQGVLGEGALVALLDTGMNLNNPEYLNNPRVLTGYNAVNGSTDVSDNINHGTHVAGVIAAGGNGTGMYGVAPLARLLMVKVFNGGTASSTHINRGLDHAMAQGARVVNMSFGTTTPLGDSALRRAAASNQAVLVIASGNEGSRNPNWPGHYARERWANGTMLVVGAVDSSNRMASFSNRAGDTAQVYLVAPGVNVLSAYGSSYGYMTGTSMAAPAVSGAAALITGYWPYLKANQVAAILLTTADDLGAPGVDAVYGHGLLNVSRALSPVGQYTYRAANGRTVTVGLATQGQVAQRQPAVVTPSAFAGLQTEVFDAHGRNFTSDEGQSLQVRTVLTSDMVMGRNDTDTTATQHEGLDGARWSFVQHTPAPPTGRAAPQGVMSPLSAGFSPAMAPHLPLAASHGFAHWQTRQGWSFSLGDGGLSAPSLGVMRSALGRTLADGHGAQVLASPLAAHAPAHRFAVVDMPLPLQGGLGDGARWHARLATLRPDTSERRVRGAAGHVELGELNVETPLAVLNLSLGRLQERGLLGGYSHPALALDAPHQTRSLSLSGAWRLGGQWSALASWSRTDTPAPPASGLLLSASRMQADAMGAGLSAQALWRDGDRLSLAWLAPLKARNGQRRYSVVTGVDEAGEPVWGEQTVNLGSGAREWQLDGRYAWRDRADGQWLAALTWRVHPDHDGSAPNQWAGGVRYQRGF
jgi:Subtilase family